MAPFSPDVLKRLMEGFERLRFLTDSIGSEVQLQNVTEEDDDTLGFRTGDGWLRVTLHLDGKNDPREADTWDLHPTFCMRSRRDHFILIAWNICKSTWHIGYSLGYETAYRPIWFRALCAEFGLRRTDRYRSITADEAKEAVVRCVRAYQMHVRS